MKWMITINACFLLTICMADMYAQSPYVQDESFKYKSGNIYHFESRLSKSELQAMLGSADFDKYVSGRKLLVSGSALSAVGGAFAAVNVVLLARHLKNQSYDPLHNVDVSQIIYTGNTILGGTIMLAGVTCLCVGVSRLKQVSGQLNSSELSLSYTGTGMNLIFRF